MSIWVLVLAAGSGSRFGGSKQFAPLGDRRVIDWSLTVAREVADGVIVVLNEDDMGVAPTLDADSVVNGGPTRSSSTKAGLQALPADTEIVLVHDAARPLASRSLYESVIGAVREGADAAVPGVPVSDTVKRVTGAPSPGVEVEIKETLDREQLVAVQTPQAFSAPALRRAYERDPEATDDAAVVEQMGGHAVVVLGERANLKLTLPEDLLVLEALSGQ